MTLQLVEKLSNGKDAQLLPFSLLVLVNIPSEMTSAKGFGKGACGKNAENSPLFLTVVLIAGMIPFNSNRSNCPCLTSTPRTLGQVVTQHVQFSWFLR